MSVWFEGSSKIDCDFEKVKKSFENLGEHYVGIVRLMPELTNVELIDQDNDFVTIETNEGLMKRTNIKLSFGEDSILIEFDEEYKAGAMVTTVSHFSETFTNNKSSVEYHFTISDLKAPGFFGFFYRKFGSSNTGSAFLSSHRTYFEKSSP